MPVLSSVLFNGHDELLLQTRGRIFELAGFRVSFARELRQISRLIGERSVDLIVLCHSLSRTECTTVGLIARNERIEVLRLLMMESGCMSGRDCKMREVADGVFDWMRGPEALLDEACRMLQVAPRWTPSETLPNLAARMGAA